MKMNRRGFSRLLMASGAIAGGGSMIAQKAAANPTAKAPRRLVFDVTENMMVRRNPETGEVLSAAFAAYSTDDLGRFHMLRNPLHVEDRMIQSEEEPGLGLPLQLGGVPDLSDLEGLDESDEPIVVEFNLLGPAGRVMEADGFLAVSGATTPSNQLKIGSITVTVVPKTDVDPPCVGGDQRYRGARYEFDAKITVFGISVGSRRLFSAWLSMNGGTRYFHGEITSLFSWCKSFSAIYLRILEEMISLLARGLEVAGYRQTASSIQSMVNTLISITRRLVPGLIP